MTEHYRIEKVGRISWHKNEIKVLIVKPDCKRKGNGSLLLRKAEEEISKKYDHVSLLAFPVDGTISKEDLFKFYNKNGYYQLSWIRRIWYDAPRNLFVKYF